jgi:hypothetical protein
MMMFDIETLGTESTSVVLSAAITYFDFSDAIEDRSTENLVSEYNRYVMTSCFVKFNALEQRDLGRVDTTGTKEWWIKQSQMARETSFYAKEDDLSAAAGIARINSYIDAHGGPNQIVWARGSLDQMCWDSLCRSAGQEPLVKYNMWRDVRTAIDLLASESKGGYAMIPGFDPDLYVVKHIPQNDCALDIMELLYHV